MRGSYRIATILGIPVHIHWTFGLLLLFVIYVAHSNELNVAFFSLSVLALFLCVLLHEFGHALAARRYGVSTRDITILPIGGVARLNYLPENPFQEFVVALAGPAVNLVIFMVLALLLYLGYQVSFSFNEILLRDSEQIIIDPTVGFLVALMQANLILFLFNLIPAFPMDGGRVLRALLSMGIGRRQATQWAAWLGQLIAACSIVLMILPALFLILPEESPILNYFDWIWWRFQPVLIFVAAFVIYTARRESQQVVQEDALNFEEVGKVMRTDYSKMRSTDWMQTAILETQKGVESNFLVFDETDALRGVLQEDDIYEAMKHKQNDALISTYTTTDFQTLQPTDRLKKAYDLMQKTQQYSFPVADTEGVILGIIEWASLQKVMVKS